jgi:TRAP-type C4-dicarboxylate transport system permease small subunit
MIFDLVLKDFALVGFCVGFFAALTGQCVMRQARQATSASGRNFERNSYIAFAIGSIVLISALLMTFQFALNIVQNQDEYEGGICEGLRF